MRGPRNRPPLRPLRRGRRPPTAAAPPRPRTVFEATGRSCTCTPAKNTTSAVSFERSFSASPFAQSPRPAFFMPGIIVCWFFRLSIISCWRGSILPFSTALSLSAMLCSSGSRLYRHTLQVTSHEPHAVQLWMISVTRIAVARVAVQQRLRKLKAPACGVCAEVVVADARAVLTEPLAFNLIERRPSGSSDSCCNAPSSLCNRIKTSSRLLYISFPGFMMPPGSNMPLSFFSADAEAASLFSCKAAHFP